MVFLNQPGSPLAVCALISSFMPFPRTTQKCARPLPQFGLALHSSITTGPWPETLRHIPAPRAGHPDIKRHSPFAPYCLLYRRADTSHCNPPRPNCLRRHNPLLYKFHVGLTMATSVPCLGTRLTLFACGVILPWTSLVTSLYLHSLP